MPSKSQLDPNSPENHQLIFNLTYRWPQFGNLEPAFLIKAYNEFALSDYFGGNDERFLEFMEDFFPEDSQ